MKASKDCKAHHLLGMICFLMASVFSFICIFTNRIEFGLAYLAFGIAVMCLFWIMGIEHDLYSKEEVKKNE